MRLNISSTGTRSFPQTYKILKKLLPAIYKHKCLNGEELPFEEEVLDTEIGHLFEHIAMEYLHQLKNRHQCQNRKVSGETSWDWSKEARGTFHIVVDSLREEENLLNRALNKAAVLMSDILKSGLTASPSTAPLFLPGRPALSKGQ